MRSRGTVAAVIVGLALIAGCSGAGSRGVSSGVGSPLPSGAALSASAPSLDDQTDLQKIEAVTPGCNDDVTICQKLTTAIRSQCTLGNADVSALSASQQAAAVADYHALCPDVPITSSTPAPVVTTPSPAFVPTTLLDISGNDRQQTQQFTVPSGSHWSLAYSYDCSGFGLFGNFIVGIYSSNGRRRIRDQGAKALGVGGLKVQHYNDSGTFHLTINSECSWTVKALTTQ
jgi:hypothetical protein